MKFEDWFHEIEAFSSRAERFWDEMSSCPSEHEMEKWLRAAYAIGRAHERIDMTPSLSEARLEELAKAAEETPADANINAGWLGTKTLDGYNG